MIRAVTGAAAWCRAAETDDDDAAGYHRVCEEFLAALSLNPCVIIIDGIDELRDSDGLTPQKVGPLLVRRPIFRQLRSFAEPSWFERKQGILLRLRAN